MSYPPADPLFGNKRVDAGVPIYDSAFAITKSDSTVLAQPTRALWIGGAGNVNVTMWDGTVALFQGVAAGTLLPIRVTQVLSSNTTATLIIGLA